MQPGVFVSYSQSDHACAFELVERLEAEGIACWVAPRDIAPAADWAAEIIDAIARARVMILIFSSSSNNSSQVRREVERAVHNELSILPFRIEEVLPSKSLEYFLSAQHWLDAFPRPLDVHYRQLCAVVRRCLGAESAVPGPDRVLGADAPGAAVLRAEQLGAVQAVLAEHLGPIARLLVKRASQRAHSREDLIRQLAAELPSDAERERFVSSCRALGEC